MGSVEVRSADGRVVGEVRGHVFYKTFKGSRHMLRKPRAICNDVVVLEAAERAGAREVQERDTETGRLYVASIQTIRAHGFIINRGHGEQLALCLNRWHCDGQAGTITSDDGLPVRVEQLAFELGPLRREW